MLRVIKDPMKKKIVLRSFGLIFIGVKKISGIHNPLDDGDQIIPVGLE
jgi:hypothetical protein